MCPPEPGGQGLGKRHQSLCPQLGLERTQGSPSAAWNKQQLPPSPSPSPAPPDKRRNGRKMQYLPPPAQAWPLQRKRRAVTQENPRGGPTTHQLPWWQGDDAQRGACRRTGAFHLPEAPAGGRGPPRAAGRFSSSSDSSPLTADWLRSACSRRNPEGETTHPSVPRLLPATPKVDNSRENSSGEKTTS